MHAQKMGTASLYEPLLEETPRPEKVPAGEVPFEDDGRYAVQKAIESAYYSDVRQAVVFPDYRDGIDIECKTAQEIKDHLLVMFTEGFQDECPRDDGEYAFDVYDSDIDENLIDPLIRLFSRIQDLNLPIENVTAALDEQKVLKEHYPVRKLVDRNDPDGSDVEDDDEPDYDPDMYDESDDDWDDELDPEEELE